MRHLWIHRAPMAWIASWALRLGITSPRRARQQASVARQWGLGLIICCHITLMEAYASEGVGEVARAGAVSASASTSAAGSAHGLTRFDAQEQGWQWYQAPEEDEGSEEPVVADQSKVTPTPLSPSAQKALLQQATREALDTAILYASPEHFRRYMLLQNFWTTKAGEFTQSAKEAFLRYPELDYNLQYSHYNGTASTQQAMDRASEQEAIAALSQKMGLFLFYRGNQPLDAELAKVVARFSQTHKLALIPVTVDGTPLASFPTTRPDGGQAKRLGITHFPALVLVDPINEAVQPLAYGFITGDDLARQFLNVATRFKANY